jgi:hypothetical protein
MAKVNLDDLKNAATCAQSTISYIEIDADTYSDYTFLAMKLYEQAFTIIGLISVLIMPLCMAIFHRLHSGPYVVIYIINIIIGIMGLIGFGLCFTALLNCYNIIDKMFIFNEPAIPNKTYPCKLSYKYDNSNGRTQVIEITDAAISFLQFILFFLIIWLMGCIFVYTRRIILRARE